MPKYQCRLFNENEALVRVEELSSGNDFEARSEAKKLMIRTGKFRGYELWHQGRKIEDYRPAAGTPSG